MKRFEMFIGSSYVVSGEASAVKVIASWGKPALEYIVNMGLSYNHIDGYSASWIKGYWKGEMEDTYHVIIFTDIESDILVTMVEKLRNLLKQQSILITIDNDIHFIG